MEPERYNRNTFAVEAVQLSDDNHDEVASWCMGSVKEYYETKYIAIPVHLMRSYVNGRESTMARVGDWITRTDTGFKVYSDKKFRNIFTVAPKPVEDPAEKHAIRFVDPTEKDAMNSRLTRSKERNVMVLNIIQDTIRTALYGTRSGNGIVDTAALAAEAFDKIVDTWS